MKIIIFGFTGAGKTTHLESLKSDQHLVEYEFLDLDNYIVSLYKDFSTLKDLISAKGWAYFRKIELDSIKQLLNKPKVVLALGGGSVSNELVEYLKGIKDLRSVFLDVDFVTCWNRIKNDENRPITLDGVETCEVLYKERLLLFKELESLCLSY